jgi:hypothetical protein
MSQVIAAPSAHTSPDWTAGTRKKTPEMANMTQAMNVSRFRAILEVWQGRGREIGSGVSPASERGRRT